ncbi:hypothetical protein Patl1_29152 [Pistacia atlantica]|uniref:Uncharacterized protein n=1 Tax=Pistacia atlantica TaxID=434234 RepID=A0ACC1BC45_9ROSI|nr:hypothetical protein Patl1_29152 [Pistacia atlantica]
MDSETESRPHSPPHNTHVNLQHSLGLLTFNPSDTQDQTPPIGARGAPELLPNRYASSRTTTKMNRRLQRAATDRRRRRLRTNTRLYHQQFRAQIQSLTRENERLMKIEDLRLAAEAAGLNVFDSSDP